MNKPNISIFFPVYNDERTVKTVTEKALVFGNECAGMFEVIIINDCSPDNSGKIADELANIYSNVRVIHHPKNLGYGAAVKSGLGAAQYDYICFTDGDDEYDMEEFKKLIKLKDYYDLIISFRYKKIYSNKRIFISYIYNRVLRWIFRTNFRDISTGLRMVRKDILADISLITDSPFIGAELTIKTMLKGYRVGEVGIQTFPRKFGQGSSTSFKNIMRTITDMRKVYLEIFSDHYDLPKNRQR
jgi:glycosyltransferase involved in cell wall biosynthesis